MTLTDPALLDDVARYYAGKLAEHGATSRGVDWNGDAGQHLRFAQLARLLPREPAISVNDIGCGYGALFDVLADRHPAIDYRGCDIAPAMIEVAQERLGGDPRASFVTGADPGRTADFTLASGIFNVRLSQPDDAWRAYIGTTLDMMARTSARGFAFNCLTSWSDADRMRPDLYYAVPGAMFDLCKRRYARNVALLHDYDLYEFTILVRTDNG